MDLEPLDPSYVANVLSRPPFVEISGVYNVRDLGSYPSSQPGKVTKQGVVYRSAEISSVTEEGKSQIKALGITQVFDLRSDTEIEKYNTPIPEIDGLTIAHTPVFEKEDYSPEMMAKYVRARSLGLNIQADSLIHQHLDRRFRLYASGKTEAFMELYSQILEYGGSAFGEILRHVRDKPSNGRLIHCTAGKDRTGVISAILLKLAGVDDEDIAKDYALTRVGREPARQMVMERLSKEPIFAANTEAALNMFTCRHETMVAFLSMLQDKYGGVEAYVKRYAELSDEDIAAIRSNLLVPSPSRL